MSLLRKRRVAGKFKRRPSNLAHVHQPAPRVIYNPYSKKLYVSKKRSPQNRVPQFKLGKKFENNSDWYGDVMREFPAANDTRFLLQNCMVFLFHI